MATYTITAPDGHAYDVTAPETASQDEVLAYAKQNYSTASHATQAPTPAPSFLDTMSNAADKIQGTMPFAAGLMAPTLGLGYKAAESMNNASGALGESTADLAARHGVPGPYAAALGMGASIASNPMTYLDPAEGISGKVMRPVVPAERAFDVATAQKYGLPMTRADLTGGVGASRVETGLSGTITGGGPFQEIAAQKLAAIDRAKTSIQSKFGTNQPLSSSGLESKLSMQDEMGAANKTAGQLYKDIPDVSIPTHGFEKALNDLDFSNIDRGASATINEIKGRLGKQAPATEQTTSTIGTAHSVGPVAPDLPVISDAASKTGEPYAVFQGNMDFGAGNQYSTYKLLGDHPRSGGNFGGQQLATELPGVRVKGMTQKAMDMGHSPVDAPNEIFGDVSGPPRFQKLNDIRNMLSKEIQSDTTYNPISGNQVGAKAQTLIPLKKALDQDLQNYVKQSQGDPLGKMQSNEFATSFGKANKFYGDMKNLKNNRLVRKLSQVTPSDIPDTVFGSGNVEDLNIAKAAMGQKGFTAAKQQWFNKLLSSKNLESQIAKLDNPHAPTGYEPEFLKGALNAEELNALKEAASLKKTSLTAEKLAGNPSGTAQRLASFATGAGLIDAARRAITSPLHALGEAAVTLGVPYLGSKAYLGTTEGVPYSFGAGSQAATRATANASSGSRQDLHAEFVRRYIKRVK